MVSRLLQIAALCLHARASKGVCVVVTPLISLALDQVSLESREGGIFLGWKVEKEEGVG